MYITCKHQQHKDLLNPKDFGLMLKIKWIKY